MTIADIVPIALVGAGSGVVGYVIGTISKIHLRHENERLQKEARILRGDVDALARRWRDAAEAHRTAQIRLERLEAENRARSEKLSKAGRAGAIKSNANRAALRADAAQNTIQALRHTQMRPRDEVVKGVPAARKRKQKTKSGAGAVAAKQG